MNKPIFKIDDEYFIDANGYNWILRYKKERVGEDGETIKERHNYYFHKISLALKYYMDLKLKGFDTAEDFLSRIENVEDVISKLKFVVPDTFKNKFY